MNEPQHNEFWQKLRSMGVTQSTIENIVLGITIPSSLLAQAVVYIFEYGFTAGHIGEFVTLTRILAVAFGVLTAAELSGLAYWLLEKNELSTLDRRPQK